MRYLELVIIFLLAINVQSCSNDSENTEEWDGFFGKAFEVNSFRPCGLDESWWITGDDEVSEEFFSRYYEVASEGCEVYINVRGIKSKKGSYGHKGASDRKFEITEIYEVRCRQEGDCE